MPRLNGEPGVEVPAGLLVGGDAGVQHFLTGGAVLGGQVPCGVVHAGGRPVQHPGERLAAPAAGPRPRTDGPAQGADLHPYGLGLRGGDGVQAGEQPRGSLAGSGHAVDLSS